MPRLARIDIEGLLQHVMVRGIERRDIFVDDADRNAFLDRLSNLLVKTETECLAWALMSNHFHLLLRPKKRKLSELMRRLLTGYAVVFNLRHQRSGHLFQNRYKSIVCEEDSYLLELVRYIHLNPIRAGIVDSLEMLDSYYWSGHAVIVGKRSLAGQSVDEVLRVFDDRRRKALQQYRCFVADGIALGKREELVGGGLKRYLIFSGSEDKEAYDERVLGSGQFVEQLWQETERPALRRETFALDDLIDRVAAIFGLDPAALREGSKRKQMCDARAALCHVATAKGYKGVEIANKMNISRPAVARAVTRGEVICNGIPDFCVKLETSRPK